jgi:UDP-glucose 4-epimerase
MKAVVIGGAGFIGAALSQALAAMGYEVAILDNFVTSARSSVSVGKVISADARDTSIVKNVIARSDLVFHLAAMAQTKDFVERATDVVDNNIGAILGVVKALHGSEIGRFIYVSSSEVYGIPTDFPTTEDAPLQIPNVSHPRWSYALTKALGEVLVRSEATRAGIPFVIARPHNVYGPGMPRHHVIPDFIERFKSGRPFYLYGSGNERRCFCFITDLVDGLIAAGLATGVEGMTFNLGTNEEVSMIELARLIGKLMGYYGDIGHRPDTFGGTPRRLPDFSLARRWLRFTPKVRLRDGLRRMIEVL